MANIYFILDRSGSMETCLDDTIGGFNAFVKNQQETNEEANLSLYLFDNEYKTLYEKRNIKSVEMLNRSTYVPRGSTALLDAMGKTIKNIQTDNNIVVILTDGHENCSKQYTSFHIQDLINMKKDQGWDFVFLAANQDAIATANTFGIPKEGAMTFDQGCVNEVFNGLSAAITRQATGEDVKVSFTELERSASQPIK